MVAIIDDSFKKPGAIPFKWEIRPGVPRVQPDSQLQPLSPPALPPPSTPFRRQTTARPLSRSPSPIKRAINPPPMRLRQPECVSSRGCFPSTHSLLGRKAGHRSSDVGSESARWSVSSRRSVVYSPPASSESPGSSSFSSWQTSPRSFRPVSDDDPEWGGYGLF